MLLLLPAATYYPGLSRFGMFMSVDRQEILAAIDAQIARLQRARFLIAQSVVPGRPDNRPLRTKRRTGKPVASGAQLTTPSHPKSQILREQRVLVSITRIPTKEARQRVIRAETTHRTALTGKVPQGPIAVPPNKNRGTATVLGVSVAHTSPAPASAFGLAIARELASL